jgi:holliday junction DNA helicase RuvB
LRDRPPDEKFELLVELESRFRGAILWESLFMDEITRMVSPQVQSSSAGMSESGIEKSLRPAFMQDYVGQTKIKESLSLFMEAARTRGDALDHVLLAGPPGLGKTTLAHIIAHEMGAQLHVVTGPNIEKKGDLAAVLSNLQPRDVLFIDEVHRLQKTIEEVLYGAMEDFKLDLIIGQGPAARTLRIDLPPFTLVGATTRAGLLSTPLRDRFGVQFRLDFYPVPELEKIVYRSAQLLGVGLDDSGAHEIARRSRGTPRIANRLLKRVRDFAQVQVSRGVKRGGTQIDHAVAREALQLLEVDERGLDLMDRKFLMAVIDKFDGGPVGIETLSSALGEERDTLEEVYEPYLVQEGLMQRTPRGRMATRLAYEHFGLPWVKGEG